MIKRLLETTSDVFASVIKSLFLKEYNYIDKKIE